MNIVAANILNDIFKSEKYPKQIDRIPVIVNDVINNAKNIDIFYVCEGTVQSINLLAKSLGLIVAGKPHRYSKNNDYAAFLLNKKYSIVQSVKFIKAGSKRSSKFGFITLNINGILFVGVHYPYKPLFDGAAKKDFTKTILSTINSKPALVIGDFNNPSIMKSRKSFVKNGLVEVVYKNKLKNPSEDFVSVITPKFYPRLFIDSAYYSPEIHINYADMFYSRGTDHPIQSISIENKK